MARSLLHEGPRRRRGRCRALEGCAILDIRLAATPEAYRLLDVPLHRRGGSPTEGAHPVTDPHDAPPPPPPGAAPTAPGLPVPGRELDALVAEALGLEPIEWRFCERDWSSGILEEVQTRYAKLSEANGDEKHPCYVARSGDEGSPPFYQPVKEYSTDSGVAWVCIALSVIRAGGAAWWEGDGHTGYRAGMTLPRRAEATSDSGAAHALCLAYLQAVEATP